jgi:hypothetical protein
MGRLDNINYIQLAAGTTGAEEISGMASGSTVEIKAGSSNVAHVLTLTVDAAATGTSDELNLKMTSTSSDDYAVAAIANVETINVDATESTASSTVDTATIDLTITQAAGKPAQTVNFTGTENITTGAAIDAAVINASGLTAGKLTMAAASTITGGQTITGSAKADTLWGSTNGDTINGGAGNDDIYAGTGADTVDGGDGTDTYITNAADTDSTIDGAGTGTSTGMVVNLSSSAVSAASVTNIGGEFLGGSLSEMGAGKAGYVFDASAASNSSLVDTITNVENITFTDGINHGYGSDGANTLTGGSGTDYFKANGGADTVQGNGGADIINLTETTSAVDTVIFALATDGGVYFDGAATDGIINAGLAEDETESTATSFSVGDFISGFAIGTDVINITGTLAGLLEASGATAVLSSAGVNGDAAGIFIVDNSVATTADFGDLSDVATDIDTAMAGGSNNTNGDEFIFVLSSTDNTQKGIYYVKDADSATDTGVDVDDTIALLGIVDHGSAGDFLATSIVVA